MWKWGGIAFGLGMALIVVEILMAKRKPEGYTPIDGRRVWGLFWLTVFVSCLVMILVWMTPD